MMPSKAKDKAKLANEYAGCIKLGPPEGKVCLVKVDIFSGKAHIYLCTHAHSDHLLGMQNLCKKWKSCDHGGGKIYCTRETKDMLLMSESPPHENSVEVLDYDQPILVPLPNSGEDEPMAEITAIDANHCTGSAMFLVKYGGSTILHTGDFRFSEGQVAAIRPHLNEADNGVSTTNFRGFTDVTFNHESWDPEQWGGQDRRAALPTAAQSVRTMLEWRHRLDPNEQKEVHLLHCVLGGEAIIRELFAQTGTPVLFPPEDKVLTQRARVLWDYVGREHGDAVCFTEEEWRARKGFIRALPFTMPRTKGERRAWKKLSREAKGSKNEECKRVYHEQKEQRRREYHKWNEWHKLQRALEREETTEADIPLFFRLSTLAFCRYEERGRLAWKGSYSEERSFRIFEKVLEADGREVTHDLGHVKIYRILHLMHSPRSEIWRFWELLGKPWVFCGLHGQSHTAFGQVMMRGSSTYQEGQLHGLIKDDRPAKPHKDPPKGKSASEVFRGADGDSEDDWRSDEDSPAPGSETGGKSGAADGGGACDSTGGGGRGGGAAGGGAAGVFLQPYYDLSSQGEAFSLSQSQSPIKPSPKRPCTARQPAPPVSPAAPPAPLRLRRRDASAFHC